MKFRHLLFGLSVISVITFALISRQSRSIPIIQPPSPPDLLILPHHDIARPLVFKGLSTIIKRPKRIILLSPNHQEIGNCNICLFSLTQTPNEQGVTALLPLLQNNFPEVSVSAYIFKKDTSLDEINHFISQFNYSDTLLVGSIDFSHYLNKDQADKKDLETIHYIKDHNYQKIKSLSSDHLDSPPVIVTILKIAEIHELELNLVARGSSADFVGQATDTTSYLVYSSTSGVTPSQPIDNQIKIVAVGDIMLGRSVNTMIQKQKDFSFPAQKIISGIPKSDLFLVNLESPFADSCPFTDTGMIFCADPRSVATLNTLGVNVATLANNHIGNQRQAGLDKTIAVLNQNNIKPISTSQILKIKNMQIGLIAFNDIPPYTVGINKLSEDSLVNQIKEIKNKADFAIITPHWGNEYQLASSRQKTLARLAIDSGADLVIGHHPHWVQEVEEYKGKLIYYSLGNFIFDQMWSEKTRQGMIANIVIENNKIISHSEIKIYINRNYQPELLK